MYPSWLLNSSDIYSFIITKHVEWLPWITLLKYIITTTGEKKVNGFLIIKKEWDHLFPFTIKTIRLTTCALYEHRVSKLPLKRFTLYSKMTSTFSFWNRDQLTRELNRCVRTECRGRVLRVLWDSETVCTNTQKETIVKILVEIFDR